MKKNQIIKTAIALFGTAFALLLVINYSKFPGNGESKPRVIDEPDPKPRVIYEESIPIENLPLEQKIYWSSYEKGRKALLGQMGIVIKNKNSQKEFDYTSMVKEEEVSDEEKSKYEEIRDKAYVEGYHKAAENFHCPRNN